MDEAVRSVRRGEMSVHRAGSFYGVPHSTLEYKVKERNLTRTKCKRGTAEHMIDTSSGNHPMGFFAFLLFAIIFDFMTELLRIRFSW